MNFKIIGLALTVAAGVAVADVRDDVRKNAEGQIAEGKILGAVVAAKDFAPLAVGNRIVDPSPVAMDVETRFDCASVTKTVVAMTCARLAAQGNGSFTLFVPHHEGCTVILEK